MDSKEIEGRIFGNEVLPFASIICNLQDTHNKIHTYYSRN